MSSLPPVNIALLRVKDSDLSRLGQIKELQIFGQGSNFHQDGLFSTQIFGPIGSEHRTRMFGYIDLRYPILHPLVYKTIITLKSFYKGIMDGSISAVWNPKLRQFEKSNEPTAQTGYTFFLKHVADLSFESNASDKRTENIKFFNKAVGEDKHLMRYMLVMPAGLRDYTISPNGKPEEDEVNTFYRRILAQSQLVDADIARRTPAD
jgi:DNA-directed RNA polymerase beta' subunit